VQRWTLGGLRHTLAETPELAKRVIRFQNDRYRLNAAAVAWSDAAEFETHLAVARQAADPGRSLALLEAARALYRGDYLDDCPFYGDSVFVEDRRTSLRDRYADLLVQLGERYERGGDRAAAAAVFREAAPLGANGSPPAVAGLARVATGG
jgi:DNA-binding SARP family transcriptional activator